MTWSVATPTWVAPSASEPQHRRQHAADGGHLLALLVDVGRDAEEVPEQLVGSVDEMDLDGHTVAARRRHREHRPGDRQLGTSGRELVPMPSLIAATEVRDAWSAHSPGGAPDRGGPGRAAELGDSARGTTGPT